nr:MAG: ORF1 [Torque teno midi virus]
MPYFWRNRWYRPRYRYRNPYRRRRRPARKRQFRRTRKYFRWRRRRKPRRRYRVRKKKKTLVLKQWQPEHIRKCKIKGFTPLIICGEGRQQFNFTQHRYELTPAKMAGGGSFAHMVWNLAFLYEEHENWRNFWTTPNEGFDLGRYTGTRLRIFRPPTVDVVAMYTTNYPMLVNMGTHPACHPQRIILSFKRKIIPSLQRKPHGKPYTTIKIKPPQLLQNKWFFQKDLAPLNLFQLYISTCDLSRPNCNKQGDNNSIGFSVLNTNVFKSVAWKKTVTIWQPQQGKYLYGYIKSGTNYTKYLLDLKSPYNYPKHVFYKNYLLGISNTYLSSTLDTDANKHEGKPNQTLPVNDATYEKVNLTVYCRYNPLPDDGDDNTLYLLGMLRDPEGLHPSTNYQFKLTGLPMWLITYGFYDWMMKLHKNYNIMNDYVTCFCTKFVWSEIVLPKDEVTKLPVYIPVGYWFMNGYGLFQTEVPNLEKTDWLVRSSNQSPVLNEFVKCGPFVPSPYKEDSWCVECKYTSYFKWGGTAPPQQDVVDPATQTVYPTPSDLSQRLQIKDPRKQTELHPWNFRRDILTRSALKRIRKDSQSETDSDSFSESKPKKSKSEVQPYYGGDKYSDQEEETETQSSSEEETSQNLQEKIQQQQQQQRRLRKLLYRALIQLKRRTRHLSILTGPIE